MIVFYIQVNSATVAVCSQTLALFTINNQVNMSNTFSPPRSSAIITPAKAQTHKLQLAFEFRAKYGINPGDVLHCCHTVPVQGQIATSPVPSSRTEFEVEGLNIAGGSNITYVGPVFDFWTNYLFLHFIDDSRSVYYNYWRQHQAGDVTFETTFTKITK